MTDHEADIATLHQEATQLRARIKRLEYVLRRISDVCGDAVNGRERSEDVSAWVDIVERVEREANFALQESSQ